MLKRDKITELLGTAATIVALGCIVFLASAIGARGLSEIYNGTDSFGSMTMFAITAFRWTPFLFGGLLLSFIWIHVRHGECRWASWCALIVAGLTTGLVLYGMVLPFASTTFRMGN
ncbi:hypothetical protein JIN85_06000 [Luteolibacter pohnpeiensis]|uniref:Uncharacterized protein n=1 Tax=Luteolibacter pohnpeiensis TaxID=454153 RepID=A0A934SAV9_9BACT|nr:hypothetical protein [Luteolibacter pohnpeiensis]MBK1881958.1 hypothetical protein [Luteolibacter pohnpeiensis]